MGYAQAMAGPLALVGGDEFHPGNEPQDTVLRDAVAGRPAYIVATAAGKDAPQAVATAQRWFSTLGLQVEELPIRTVADAKSSELAARAAGAGLLYLAGGDPGHVAAVFRDTPVRDAIRDAWLNGAAVAGSSAGAMVLCEWTLIRADFPGHTRRRAVPAMKIVPGCAVLPHFDAFGERWIPSAQEALGDDALLVGLDERTAAVWRDGSWTALGPGLVTLVRGGQRNAFTGGELVEGMAEPAL